MNALGTGVQYSVVTLYQGYGICAFSLSDRCVGDKNAVLLLDALTPNTLSSLLASSHLQKR